MNWLRIILAGLVVLLCGCGAQTRTQRVTNIYVFAFGSSVYTRATADAVVPVMGNTINNNPSTPIQVSPTITPVP